MKVLQAYLGKTVIQAIVIVLIILAGLELFILFVNELHDIGKGSYGILEAFTFSLLQLPMLIYEMFPLICLLGALFGLGLLASHSELTVMRSAGFAISQIAFSVVCATLACVLVITILGEVVAPTLGSYAQQRKSLAKSGGQAIKTAEGLWLRDGKSFIHINEVHPGGLLKGIHIYHLNDKRQLQEALYAEQGHYKNHQWQLEKVNHSLLDDVQVQSKQYATYLWKFSLDPSLLRVSKLDPDAMSLLYLHHYIQGHGNNNVNVDRYQFAFWSRLFQPIASCVMVLLAIPFVFGLQRNMTTGARLLIGITLGFGFYLLNQFIGPVSLVWQVPPILAASMSTFIFGLLAVWLMWRVR